MKAYQLVARLREMASDGQVLVQGADGRWTRVEAVRTTAVDTIYAPTSLLIDGVRYVREDQTHDAADAIERQAVS